MTEISGYEIRYTAPTDDVYLRDWLMRPNVACWFAMNDEKEREDAIQCWIGFCRYGSSLTATIDGVPCGIGTLFLMPYRKVAHHCLFKLVVAPEHWRQGIGRSLLRNLKHLAKDYFRLEIIHVEVFEGNPILSLLEQLDFHPYVHQERFVKNGDQYLARILLESYL